MHAVYKYPARFSPEFTKSAISIFSKPGETVIDPFCGGGTTAIESLLNGRHSLNSDLSPLAMFLTKAKTRNYSTTSLNRVKKWSDESQEASFRDLCKHKDYLDDSSVDIGALKLPTYSTIRIALTSWEFRLRQLGTAEDLARLCLLRVGQRLLDLKRQKPSLDLMRRELDRAVSNTLRAVQVFDKNIRLLDNDNSRPICKVSQTPIKELHKEFKKQEKAKLAVFSPPYPGVHVLYPRWQIEGRKESSAPFWLAGVEGCTIETTYTMGRRGVDKTEEFMSNYLQGVKALREVLTPDALVVQMVGFMDPKQQLPALLHCMREAGYREKKYKSCETSADGRLWRSVPGQKWYNAVRDKKPATSREVVLIHSMN